MAGGSLLKKIWCVCGVFLLLAVIISGCSVSEASVGSTVIKASENKERQQAFKDLSLVSVLDFDLTWQDADETELIIWAEQYEDGKLYEEQTIYLTTYSEEKEKKGYIGMGVVDAADMAPMLVVYAPGGSIRTEIEDKIDDSNAFHGWESSINDENLKLEIGETYTLGAYRVSNGSSIRSYNLQIEDEVEKMMKDDRAGFLLKVKLTEK